MATDPQTAPHGSWPSPLSASDIAVGATPIADLRVDGSAVLWVQGDATDGGRVAVLRRVGDDPVERLSPPGFDARTRVHEYGGGALGAGHGVVLACSYGDQRVYQLGETPTAVTPVPLDDAGLRYASMEVLPGGTAFVAVRESHGRDRPRGNPNIHGEEEAVNELVRVDLRTGAVDVLHTGPDFVSGPVVNPDGSRIAWLQWDHPDMPWDTAELWVGDLGPAGIEGARWVAGGRGSAVADLAWADTDRLRFTDDPDGWWNVHELDARTAAVHRLQDEAVESGAPRWRPDRRLTAGEGPLAVVTTSAGATRIHLLDVTGGPGPTPSRALDVDGVRWVGEIARCGEDLVAIAGGPTLPTAVWRIDVATGGRTAVSETTTHPATAIGALPRPITFPTTGGATAHGLYYPPTSATHRAPDGERPPLVVMTHGGPTSAARTSLHPVAQYWASRGFAVVDVDYRGSTGYGRAYRDALRGSWGLHDVEDTVAAARHLVAEGLADGERLLIEGGSAGGFTTLLALCTTDVFAAGGSLFGVSDLRALATDTHKFESRYLDSMVGPWPAEEQRYIDRSPLSHVDSLRTPMVLLQGDEDRVVPPAQAEAMVAVLRDRGITHAYLLFPGEQHGFRGADAIIRSFEARLAFYGHVLGITIADDIDLPELVTAADLRD